jgi:hypothetical protein
MELKCIAGITDLSESEQLYSVIGAKRTELYRHFRHIHSHRGAGGTYSRPQPGGE